MRGGRERVRYHPNPTGSVLFCRQTFFEIHHNKDKNLQEHPEEFGSLFQTIKADEDSVLSLTNYFDLAVVKFVQNKVMEVMEKSMKTMNDFCKESNLCPFMIVASQKKALCVQ